MKKSYYILIISIMIFGNVFGQSEKSSQFFKTPEEAVKKATSDLIEILKSRTDLELGINIEELSNAEPGPEVLYSDIKFDLLLRSEVSTPISRLADNAKKQLYPLYLNNKIVAIVELRKEEGGWLISGFSSQLISADLNTIIQSFEELNKKSIKVYEVPNLNANIYQIQVDRRILHLTNYNNISSLKEPIESEKLLTLLIKDAKQFEEKYGPQLRKERLVK